MSYGQNPYGSQNPYGQNPYGNQPGSQPSAQPPGSQPSAMPGSQASAGGWGAPSQNPYQQGGPGQQGQPSWGQPGPGGGQQGRPGGPGYDPYQQRGPQGPGQYGPGPGQGGPGGPGQGGPGAPGQRGPGQGGQFGGPGQGGPGAPGQQGGWGQGGPSAPVPHTPVPEPEPRKASFVKRDLVVATTDWVGGYEVIETLGEVIGVATRARDMRSNPDLAVVITQSRQQAIDAMVAMAKEAGADAVLGLRFDGGKISDGTSEVTAYGTAVKLEKAEDFFAIDEDDESADDKGEAEESEDAPAKRAEDSTENKEDDNPFLSSNS